MNTTSVSREAKITEYQNRISKLIEQRNVIQIENPVMHWSDPKYKECQSITLEISDLHAKIQVLNDNNDEKEIQSLLSRDEWSWLV
jgi:hypothetical protein